MIGQILIGIALAAAIYYIVVTILIYEQLRKRGVPVSFLWLRMYAPRYAWRYRETTRQESGRPGRLFCHWIISINTALVAAIAAALLWRA